MAIPKSCRQRPALAAVVEQNSGNNHKMLKQIWCHLFPQFSCSNNTHPSLFPEDNHGTALPKGVDSSAVTHNKGLQFSAPAREGASAK